MLCLLIIGLVLVAAGVLVSVVGRKVVGGRMSGREVRWRR